MRIKLFLTFLLLMALSITPLKAQSNDQNSTISSFIKEEASKNRIPGVSLGILSFEETEPSTFFVNYGVDHNGTSISPQTSFLLASVSKTITAFATVQLHDQGKLNIEDKVTKYLPEFKLKNREYSDQITIQQLLNHTSGIPTEAYYFSDAESLKEHIKTFEKVNNLRKPGEQYEYSSANFQILGAIIEEASGNTLESYFRENIFTPLEMKHTFTSQEEALKNGMTKGHQYWFGYPKASTQTYSRLGLPNGFIISSTEDMLRFLSVHLNDGKYKDKQIISPEGLKLLFTASAKITEKTSIGLGWRLGPLGGQNTYWHGGEWQDFLSEIAILPEQKKAIIITANAASMFDHNMTERMITGTIQLLTNQTLPESKAGRVTKAYLYINIGIGFALLIQMSEFWKLRKYNGQIQDKLQDKFTAFKKVYLPLAFEAVTPVLIIVVLGQIGLPFSRLFTSLPDIGWVVIGLVVASYVQVFIKGGILGREFFKSR